ncbi:MAG: cytochrome C [Cyanobacteria bacterium P01_A01_bin.135]
MSQLIERLRRFPSLVIPLCLGFALVLAQGTHASAIAQTAPARQDATADTTQVGTVDPIPPEFQLGRSLYIEACASCHIAIPPALLPDATWQQVLQEPGHYGVQISPPTGLSQQLIWPYLRQFSRSLQDGELPPYRLEYSRYFKALHPKVEFTEPVRLRGCVTCHPQATVFNFRQLSPEWADAP